MKRILQNLFVDEMLAEIKRRSSDIKKASRGQYALR